MAGAAQFIAAGFSILAGFNDADAIDKSSRALERSFADQSILRSMQFRSVLHRNYNIAAQTYIATDSSSFLARMRMNEQNYQRNEAAARASLDAQLEQNKIKRDSAIIGGFADAASKIASAF